MRKCNCNRDLNISSADINLRKNEIQIVISREPDTPLIAEIRRQIEELREIGLEFENLDVKVRDILSSMDYVTKAALMQILEEYSPLDPEQLKQDIKAWADSRYMRKMFLSQAAYDALETKEENVLYCIV